MSDPRDDDALSWDGDDDPTLDVGSATPAPEVLPKGYHAVGKGAENVRTAEDTEDAAPIGTGAETHVATASAKTGSDADDDEAPQTGNVALVAYGILGGIYLLYTVGWIIGGMRLQDIAPFLLVSPAAYVPAFWLAVLAPAIWFASTLALTRTTRTWVRFVWLGAGVVLLVPWPFIMIGAVG